MTELYYTHNGSEYRIINTHNELTGIGHEVIVDKNKNSYSGHYYFNNGLFVFSETYLGYKEYILNNERHNLSGAAREWESGKKEYWIHGKHYVKTKYWNHHEVILYNKLCYTCSAQYGNLLDLMNHFKKNHRNHKVINYIYKILLT